MTLADSSKAYNPWALGDYFEAAGITQYAEWASQVEVHPGGDRTLKPRPYQVGDLNHLAANLPRSALWSDPGTGKTLPLQAFALWVAGLGNKVICLMPPGLVPQFHHSFHRNYSRVEKHVRIEMLQGDLDARGKKIAKWNREGWPDVLLMSYEMFRGRTKAPRRPAISKAQEKMLENLPLEERAAARERLASEALEKAQEENKKYQWRPRSEVTAHNLRMEVFEHLGYNMVICDEAHKVKTHDSEIHISVRDFVQPWQQQNSNGLVLATGSPIETNVTDAFGLINLLDPRRYGSMRVFDDAHCVLLEGTRFRKVLSYKNLDLLHQNLYAVGRRITKKEAFKDMPERIITEVPLELSKEHHVLYRKLVNEQVLELEDRLIDATVQQRMYQYLQQVLVCPEKFSDKPIKDNAIISALDDIVDSLGGKKILVFSWYQDSIAKLAEHYQDLKPAVINGEVNGTKREKEKARFINDDNCRMVIANPASAGVGIDGWQKVCSYMAFAEVVPFPGVFEQAVGRLERSGMTEAVNIFLLVPRGTIAMKLMNDLCRKEAEGNAVVRDKKQLIAELLGEMTGD